MIKAQDKSVLLKYKKEIGPAAIRKCNVSIGKFKIIGDLLLDTKLQRFTGIFILPRWTT
jgi:hypothetical protein